MRLTELYQAYRDSVEFLVVYVKEAHASDKWWLGRSRTQRAINALAGRRSGPRGNGRSDRSFRRGLDRLDLPAARGAPMPTRIPLPPIAWDLAYHLIKQ